jgi:hypothetical protein
MHVTNQIQQVVMNHYHLHQQVKQKQNLNYLKHVQCKIQQKYVEIVD